MTVTASPWDAGKYSDLALVQMFKDGNQLAFTALTDRYFSLIRAITSKYIISGLESEDLTQEGLLGFLCAVNSYREDKGASFRTYAGLCVNRRIISLLNRSGTNKSKPLNDYISLDDSDVAQGILDEVMNPEVVVIAKESLDTLNKDISDCLSDTEQRVLEYYLAGKSYAEISKTLSINEKSVDNALQRARSKLKKHIGKDNMPI